MVSQFIQHLAKPVSGLIRRRFRPEQREESVASVVDPRSIRCQVRKQRETLGPAEDPAKLLSLSFRRSAEPNNFNVTMTLNDRLTACYATVICDMTPVCALLRNVSS